MVWIRFLIALTFALSTGKLLLPRAFAQDEPIRFQPPQPPPPPEMEEEYDDSEEEEDMEGNEGEPPPPGPRNVPPPAQNYRPPPGPSRPSYSSKSSGTPGKVTFVLVEGEFWEKGKKRTRGNKVR